MLDDVTHDTFVDRVGETFRVAAADGDTLDLTLAEATLAPEGHSAPGSRAAFSLIFHGPVDRYAPQGIWRLEHPEVGRLDVFLVPLGPAEDVMRYQAVFS